MVAVGTEPTYRTVAGETDEQQRCGNATFAVRPCAPHRVAVAVIGEIDAVNGRALARYVERHTRVSRQLVLDLRAVDFFGSQGSTALYYISVHCTRSDVDWAIVASSAVQRLLAICDPDRTPGDRRIERGPVPVGPARTQQTPRRAQREVAPAQTVSSTTAAGQAPKYSWMCRIAMAPSPTAEATRLTEPLRTSPAANTPGRLVSSIIG